MSHKTAVFLSGGFKTNWQQKVIEAVGIEKFIFLNPREHGIDNSDLYTTWDIHFVKKCDILFAYMESTNPSGFGLAFELGVAYALNKTIILVDEKSKTDELFSRYFQILRKPSGSFFDNIEEGIKYLKKFSI